MASLLVSISFPMPLSAPKFSFKELQLRKSAVTRLSGQATSGTATNLLVPCNATGEILSVNQSCGGCLATPTNHFYRLVSSCMHTSSCTHKIITGYWVGPDIDDGWGFVEEVLACHAVHGITYVYAYPLSLLNGIGAFWLASN